MMIWLFAIAGLAAMFLWQADMLKTLQTDNARQDVSVLADEFSIYHSAAGRACSIPCAQGLVPQANVVAKLARFRRTTDGSEGLGSFDGTRFRSAAISTPDGEMLVTYLADVSETAVERRGTIQAKLMDKVPTESGIWTAVKTSGRIVVSGERYWIFDTGGPGGAPQSGVTVMSNGAAKVQISSSFDIPASLSSVIPEGTPVMVSRM